MKVTDSTRGLILSALRKKNISHTDLAKMMGLSKSWASRLLNGGIKTLSDEHVEKLEELLGIQFVVITESRPISGIIAKLSEYSETSAELNAVLTELLNFVQSKQSLMIPRYFETKEMSQIGQEIIRLAFANEDKPGKVARETLRLLSA